MFGGKRKAFTLSYDDGVVSDVATASVCDLFGIKCTFNVNPGLAVSQSSWTYKGFDVRHLTETELIKFLSHHEIASHSNTHPYLDRISRDECIREMQLDRDACTAWFGSTPVGMAYPMGTYNDTVVDVLSSMGYRYARTVDATHSFDVQTDLLRFNPTCHHNDDALFELAEEFVKSKPDKDMLFYVWGHSYEFEADGNRDRLTRLCRIISGCDDVFCGTNRQVLLERTDD